ncbi:WASH complex subunit 1 isoform X1 [Amborella trichopoda]|uniref:WASH1 WAHD domain-containing protein n=1 Tax=Amborella trichopoda TaxID=13333 RepID=W1NF84_AMBTC|nr:WASH complex subunit 1 isoform X1 [Amborella trichopoda]ERM93815.1 hypothetical protein AMTR_s00138p00029150 [Amborella trichopoda]|eukprot:XP_020517712.1 WASH complex subunit 1 isoform X1 [Amborella trichopoda]
MLLRVSEDGSKRRHGFLDNYRQLHQALLDLQRAADHIFDTVIQRTEKEQQKLNAVLQRIDNAKIKIDALSHTKRAATVRSSSSYPFVGEEDFKPLFGCTDGTNDLEFPIAKLLLNGGLNKDLGEDGTLELFQFFSETTSEHIPKEVKSKGDAEPLQRSGMFLVNQPPHPLIKLPHESLLRAESNSRGVPSSIQKHQLLPPPPPSLLPQASRLNSKSEGFAFKSAKQKGSIRLPNPLLDLPAVSETTRNGGGDGSQTITENINTHTPSTQTLPFLAPSPPLPPPPPSLATTSSIKEHDATETSKSVKTHEVNPPRISSLPFVDSKRAALLVSIRNPGIVLRKTGHMQPDSDAVGSSASPKKVIKSSGSENSPIAVKPKSVNLLAEVASSLKMRRLLMQGGFHGKEQAEGPDYTSSPSKSRSQGPLPDAESNVSSDRSEEDDWDD